MVPAGHDFKNQRTYIKNGFFIIADFHEGRVEMIQYYKGDGVTDQFTSEEITALLKANSKGIQWTATDGQNIERSGLWTAKSANSEIYYRAYVVGNRLAIMTSARMHRVLKEWNAKDTAKPKPSVEGL